MDDVGQNPSNVGRKVTAEARRRGNEDAIGRLAKLLEANEIDLADVGDVRQIRVNEWDVVTKGIDGTPSVTKAKAASIVLSPAWESGPKWPLVEPAKPVVVKVPKRPLRALAGGWKTAVVLPDPQIGYRRLSDGTLDPFHDEAAMSVAEQIVEAERPHLVVHLGDLLDLASMSHYRQEAAFALTVQPTLDRAYQFLATIAELADESRLLEGNHDARLSNYILDNAVAAFGLRRAGTPPTDWPVMSVPNLLRLDALGVEYIGGYPSGATYLNNELCCIHGRIVRSSKSSTAAAVAVEERTSVIFGHIHRIETQWRTFNQRGGYRTNVAHTPGCLCRIDGSVPSVKSGSHPTGRPVRSWEDWQQGLCVVRYHDDGRFALEQVHIDEGRALHGGKEFVA